MIKKRGAFFSIYHIAVLAMLIAITHISRLAFGFLPNVQPVTVIVLLITTTFGLSDGLLVASLSILLSNITMGMGPWTIAQIFAYILIVYTTAGVKKIINQLPYRFFFWSLFSAITGYFYGAILAIIQAPFFNMTVQSTISYWLAGLPFDTYHALGNIGFYYILAPVFIPLFIKTKENINKKNKEGN